MKPTAATIVEGANTAGLLAHMGPALNPEFVEPFTGNNNPEAAAMNQLDLNLQPAPKAKKQNLFDTADLSALELDKDEPLSIDVIESYKELARKVINQAIEDLGSKDEDVKRAAVRFCLDEDKRHREIRLLWLGWIDMPEDVLARAASLRLQWSAAASPSAARQ